MMPRVRRASRMSVSTSTASAKACSPMRNCCHGVPAGTARPRISHSGRSSARRVPCSRPHSSRRSRTRPGEKATWSAEPDSNAGTGPEGRWRAYDYEELIARDKASLDIFWLRDESLEDTDNLPAPGVIAAEIVVAAVAAADATKTPKN